MSAGEHPAEVLGRDALRARQREHYRPAAPVVLRELEAVEASDEFLDMLERAGVQRWRIEAMRETRSSS